MAAGSPLDTARSAEPNRHLLLVLDGLRPDYVTPEVMPNLYAFGRSGVVFTNHHSVYPTVTRVNSSSMSTGAYPERHGILGNSVFFPRVDAGRFPRYGPAIESRERFRQIRMACCSPRRRWRSAAGQRQDDARPRRGHHRLDLPAQSQSVGRRRHAHRVRAAEALYARATSELGPAPAEGHPNDARNHRAVETFLNIGLDAARPSVTAMWLNDPDTTAHALGMGHPTTVEALRRLDREIKNIQDGLRARGLLDSYNIWVTSDHGFATYVGAPDVRALLKPFEEHARRWLAAHRQRRDSHLCARCQSSGDGTDRAGTADNRRHRRHLHTSRNSWFARRLGRRNVVVRRRALEPRALG
jgi:hypothetical protein